jgi:class 3 adenylate cyclase
MPTLILHRKDDQAVPVEQGRQLAMGIPNARFKVLNGNIHLPWLGESGQVIEQILEFLGKREAGEQRYEGGVQAEELEVIEQATIVFTDIASSTGMITEVGDAAARDIILKHDSIVRDRIRIHGGRELQNLGDGFMLSFDSASLAIRCACAIQKAIAENLPSIEIRIGINTGEVIRREGNHPFGQAVVIASRIVSKSKGGQILVSDVTRLLAAGGNFTFTESGRFKPKGFNETVKLYEVSWKE